MEKPSDVLKLIMSVLCGLFFIYEGFEAIILHRVHGKQGVFLVSPTIGIIYGSLLIFIVLLVIVIVYLARKQVPSD